MTHIYPVTKDKSLVSYPTYTITQKREPDVITWRSHYPAVWNQEQLGCCTAEAMSAALAYYEPGFIPSVLFQYYNERSLEGEMNPQAGADLSTTCEAAEKYGICPDNLWPFVESQVDVKPPEACYTAAQKDRLASFYRIAPEDGENTVIAIRNAVAIGQPVLIGVNVFEGLESAAAAQTGVVPLPEANQQSMGGHAICLTGYDNVKQQFQFRNSWGADWGDAGYGYFPYQYFLSGNLISSWVVTGAD